MTLQELLRIYLNNHLTLATAAVGLFRRTASEWRGREGGVEVAALANEAAQDRATLLRLMHRLDIPVHRPMILLGAVWERLGRLKPNGYFLRRSPLSDVLELELLRDAVAAETACWQVLRAVAAHDQRITRLETEEMLDRMANQADRLYRLHMRSNEKVLHSLAAAD